MIKIILLVALSLSLASAELDADGEEYTDWKDIHYKVYTHDGQAISPEQVLAYLKELQALYTGRTDERSVGRMERVTNLIKASQVSADNCEDIQQLLERNQLLRYNRAWKVNVIPYLKFHYRKQWALCKGTIDRMFKETQEDLTAAEKADMESLSRSVVTAKRSNNPSPLYFSTDDAARGILQFLKKSKKKDIKNRYLFKKHTIESLTKMFNKHVGGLCQIMGKAFTSWTLIYSPMIIDESLAGKTDPSVFEWVRSAAVCSKILGDKDYIIKDMLREVNPKKP